MSSFYLTLHSHGDSHIQMLNDVHNFKIHLGKILSLPGKWEVGLAQILYPMSMTCMNFPYSMFQVFHDKVQDVFELRSNFYYDNLGLVNDLATLLGDLDIAVSLRGGHLHIQNLSDKDYKFFLHPKLLDILGTDSIDFVDGNTFEGMNSVDVNRGLPQQMFVHTDIINYQMVNNEFDNLLRVLPNNVESYKYGCTHEHVFQQIQYLPVARDVIDAVAVYIKDSEGNDVSFDHGTLTLVLHFRQRHD